MLSRKEQARQGVPFPKEWREVVTEELSKIYQNELVLFNSGLNLYAYSYPNEVLLIVSVVSKANPAKLPIALFLSADLEEKKNPRVILDTLFELTGNALDNVFSTDEWDDFVGWQEEEKDSFKFFYKLSREDIELTIKANQLLGEF